MIVDGHAHAHLKGNPRGKNKVLGPDWEAPVERLLDRMDQANVSKALLVPISADPENDRYVADAIQRFPGRFAAIGVHDPDDWDPASYCARADVYGLQGLRLFDLGTPLPERIESSPAFPLLAELERRDHCLWLFGKADQYSLLRQILDRLPDLKVCLNLLGYPSIPSVFDAHGRPDRTTAGIPPPTFGDVLGLAKYPSVHVMIGGLYQVSHQAHPHTDLLRVTQAVYEYFGADRCLWATDWPWTDSVPGYRAMQEIIDIHLPGISDIERRKVLGETCSQLFRFV